MTPNAVHSIPSPAKDGPRLKPITRDGATVCSFVKLHEPVSCKRDQGSYAGDNFALELPRGGDGRPLMRQVGDNGGWEILLYPSHLTIRHQKRADVLPVIVERSNLIYAVQAQESE
jgi:hypothetical protein